MHSDIISTIPANEEIAAQKTWSALNNLRDSLQESTNWKPNDHEHIVLDSTLSLLQLELQNKLTHGVDITPQLGELQRLRIHLSNDCDPLHDKNPVVLKTNPNAAQAWQHLNNFRHVLNPTLPGSPTFQPNVVHHTLRLIQLDAQERAKENAGDHNYLNIINAEANALASLNIPTSHISPAPIPPAANVPGMWSPKASDQSHRRPSNFLIQRRRQQWQTSEPPEIGNQTPIHAQQAGPSSSTIADDSAVISITFGNTSKN